MSAERWTRATLIQLESLERVDLAWNPERFSRVRRARGSGEDVFLTDLFLDASRDALLSPLETARTIASWMESDAVSGERPRVAFLWGELSFRGRLTALEEEWLRFDPHGEPTRGRLRVRIEA